MPKAARDVLADALRLEPDARAELAAELLESLDGPADPGAESAWDEEIARRIAAIEAGTVRLEPWPDVKRRIERDVGDDKGSAYGFALGQHLKWRRTST